MPASGDGKNFTPQSVANDAGTVARAYEIARSGHCATLDELVEQLKSERFGNVDAQTLSPSVRRDLRQLSQSARHNQAKQRALIDSPGAAASPTFASKEG